ncbi:MAG: dockerin type I domain-containing protein [Candidatus Poribacteria bacterium]
MVKLTNIKLISSDAELIYISTPESLGINIPAPYDLNRDGKINIFDLVLVGNRFGENVPAETGQLDTGDINGDGVVNIPDLVIIENHFGETLPAPSTE